MLNGTQSLAFLYVLVGIERKLLRLGGEQVDYLQSVTPRPFDRIRSPTETSLHIAYTVCGGLDQRVISPSHAIVAVALRYISNGIGRIQNILKAPSEALRPYGILALARKQQMQVHCGGLSHFEHCLLRKHIKAPCSARVKFGHTVLCQALYFRPQGMLQRHGILLRYCPVTCKTA